MLGKDKLSIWQQNINKLPTCQHNLISSNELILMDIDIIALQEPSLNANNCTIVSRDWTTIYPMPHNKRPGETRAATLIRSQVNTDAWTQIDFLSSNVMVIQITGSWGKLTIFNVYNDSNSNKTLTLLTNFHQSNCSMLGREEQGDAHIIWLGNFNRHHPHWDDLSNTRLFTSEAIKDTEVLIEALAEVGLELALPSGTPTHYHNVMKRWSRLDHVFISEHSENLLIACDTQLEQREINTDHLPIQTELDLKVRANEEVPAPNFCEVDWDEFRKVLEAQLATMQPAERITTQRQLNQSCKALTEAIQDIIWDQVLVAKITSKTKRWWTKELTQLRRIAGKLGRRAYKRRDDLAHPIHQEHKEAAKRYDKTL
jgi:Endonuclease-reverse transcriptase